MLEKILSNLYGWHQVKASRSWCVRGVLTALCVSHTGPGSRPYMMKTINQETLSWTIEHDPNLLFHAFNSVNGSGTKIHVKSSLNAWHSSDAIWRLHRVVLSLRHLRFEEDNLHISTASCIKSGRLILIKRNAIPLIFTYIWSLLLCLQTKQIALHTVFVHLPPLRSYQCSQG